MGATLVAGGATFRTWAPNARDVYLVLGNAALATPPSWSPGPDDRLTWLADGTWAGFALRVASRPALGSALRIPLACALALS
jgi:1,4-alpha-glucan branching enzyme